MKRARAPSCVAKRMRRFGAFFLCYIQFYITSMPFQFDSFSCFCDSFQFDSKIDEKNVKFQTENE